MAEENEKKVHLRAKELRQEFLEKYGFVEVDTKASMRRGFDAQTHEAWLMQCPKGMDRQKLVGQRIKLPGECYIGDLQVRDNNDATPLNKAVGYVNSKGEYALQMWSASG